MNEILETNIIWLQRPHKNCKYIQPSIKFRVLKPFGCWKLNCNPASVLGSKPYTSTTTYSKLPGERRSLTECLSHHGSLIKRFVWKSFSMSEQQHSTEAMENIDVSSYFALGLLAQYYRNRKQGLYYRNNILPCLLT